MKVTKDHVFFYMNKFLTQWGKWNFTENDIVFNCTEQYMMYQKAILFGDFETASLILNSEEAYEQKALGRLVKNFEEKVWNKHRLHVVFNGNKLKFLQNPKCLNVLIDTYPKLLVEASPKDAIWGIGLAESDPLIDNPDNWKGENLLGEVLTRVRNVVMFDKLWDFLKSLTLVPQEDSNKLHWSLDSLILYAQSQKVDTDQVFKNA